VACPAGGWMRYIDIMSNDSRPTLAGHLVPGSGLFSRPWHEVLDVLGDVEHDLKSDVAQRRGLYARC